MPSSLCPLCVLCPWNYRVLLTTTDMVRYKILLNLGVSCRAECTHPLPKKCAGHYPTWESAVGGFGSAKDFRQLRKSIAADPNSLKAPKPLGPRPIRIPPGEYNSFGEGHAIPFPGLLPHASTGHPKGTSSSLFVDHASPSQMQQGIDNILPFLGRTGRHDADVEKPNAHLPLTSVFACAISDILSVLEWLHSTVACSAVFTAHHASTVICPNLTVGLHGVCAAGSLLCSLTLLSVNIESCVAVLYLAVCCTIPCAVPCSE